MSSNFKGEIFVFIISPTTDDGLSTIIITIKLVSDGGEQLNKSSPDDGVIILDYFLLYTYNPDIVFCGSFIS